MNVYRFRCGACGWRKELRKSFDPGTICCPQCGDGKEIAWWGKGPADPFTPPPSAAAAEVARKANLVAEAEAIKRGEGDGGWFRTKALYRGAMPTREERQLAKLDERQKQQEAAERAREAQRGQATLPGLEMAKDRNLDHE